MSLTRFFADPLATLATLATLACIAATGCGQAGGGSAAARTVATVLADEKVVHIYHSERSRAVEPLRQVIRDQASFDSLLTLIGGEFVHDLPAIDFRQSEIIVAALGSQPSAGPTIEIDSVVDLVDRREVVVTRTDYRNGCSLPSAITRPIDVVVVRRSNTEKLQFDERTRLLPCND